MWSIVQFTLTSEIAVIPNIWLVNKNKCKWTPFRASDKVMKSVKKAEKPGDDWEEFGIEIIKSFDTFDKARTDLPRVEKGSDLSESDKEPAKKSPQLDAEDLPSNEIEIQGPAVKRGRPSLPILPQLPIEKVTLGLVREGSPPILQKMDIGTQTDKDLGGTQTDKDLDFENFVRRNMMLLKAGQSVLQESLDGILVNGINQPNPANVNNVQANTFKDLPLNSVEGVQKLEEYILEDEVHRNLLLKQISTGGGNTRDTTLRILRNLMTDKLALEYNWIGSRGEKKSFSKTFLRYILSDAVKLNPRIKIQDDDTLEKTAKEWLKNAKKRLEKPTKN